MQIDKSKTGQELGFEIPEKGDYIAQLAEGVKDYTREESGAVSLGIPMKLVEVYGKNKNPGGEKSVGKPFTHFVPCKNIMEKKIHDWGCDQIETIIVMTGLAAKFEKAFSEFDDVKTVVLKAFAKLVEFLQLNLPDKTIGIEIMHKKDMKGEMKANTKKWWAVQGGGDSAGVQVSGSSEGQSASAPADDDWA